MFNSRRATNNIDHAHGRPEVDNAWTESAFDDLTRAMEQHAANYDGRVEDLADALEAEFEAGYFTHPDPMQPVDVETGEVRADDANYDQWDDEALDRLTEELSQYDELAPRQYGHGVLPPHPGAEMAAAPAARAGFGRASLVVGVVGLVAAGAVGYAMTGGSGITGLRDPVVVAASTQPFKIVPREGDTIDEPVEPSVVFDPAAGTPPKGEERLVARDEAIPDLPGVTPQVNRVILPDGQEIAVEPVVPETGPRRVRTVLVRPDGTIIDSPQAPTRSLPTPTDVAMATDPSPIAEAIALADGQSSAGLPPLPSSEQVEAPAAEPEPLVAALESAVPPPVSDPVAALLPPVDVAPTPVAAEAPTVAPIEVPAPTAGAAPAPVLSPIADIPAAEVVPEAEVPVIVTDAPRPPARPAVPVAEAVAPAPVAEVAAPPPVAAAPAPASQDGPLDLTEVASLAPTVPATRSVAPAPEAAAPPPAEAPAATVSAPAAAYVQLSSQRSEAAALQAFRGLQQKHPGLLGGLSPDVQRADLGAKGVYYRVRVGQPSGGDANGLCTQLKAAGSDCIIARR